MKIGGIHTGTHRYRKQWQLLAHQFRYHLGPVSAVHGIGKADPVAHEQNRSAAAGIRFDHTCRHLHGFGQVGGATCIFLIKLVEGCNRLGCGHKTTGQGYRVEVGYNQAHTVGGLHLLE